MTTRFITVIFCSFSLVLGGVRAEASRGRSGLIIFGPVSGAVTTTSFTVTYRLAKSDQVCRLCLSPRKDMTVKTFTKAMKTDAACGNTVKLEANDLRADTRYYFALEVGGKLLEGSRGQCRTFPASFRKISFALGNSIDTKKLGKGRLKPDVKGGLSAASENDLAFFLCTGDLFYGDINKKDVDRFRRAYASSLSYKEAQSLFQKVPLVYVWDDHDYGHNNSGKDSPSKAESMRAYREIIPHYPLAKGKEAPIYQAFSLANVRFILTDLRSQRDSGNVVDHPDKTMMGAEQKKWFFDELKRSSKTHDVIFWVSSVPFTTSTKTRGRSGPVVVKGDDWGGYRSERGEITRFVKENHVTNLMVIGGDAHCLAAGNGEHTATYVKGGIPIPEIIAAPLLNSHKSAKGGPWSQGTSGAARKSEQLGYGLVTIEQDQTRITVTFSGRDTNQKEHVSLKVAYAKRK